MCGIGGIASTSWNYSESAGKVITRVNAALKARGPDANGIWSSSRDHVHLAHRRLSILDVDSRSDQPFSTPDGRFTIVFNGEIYNHEELRCNLESEGVKFRTASDTEVLLYHFCIYGVSRLIELRGMFSFAIYDSAERTLHLARDPYGIKPLFYSNIKNGLIFASQVKSLLASKIIQMTRDPASKFAFHVLGSIPEPDTWFKEIKALPAGAYARFSMFSGKFEISKIEEVSNVWLKKSTSASFNFNLQNHIRECLLESVNYHSRADVPLGIFLSGGIDSGVIAGLLSESTNQSITGVTIAYDEYKGKIEDETLGADIIARHFGIKHHLKVVRKIDFINDLDAIFSSMDQPSVDGINTWYASKAAKEAGLKVVLSGIGGDELFFGYESFRTLPAAVKTVSLIKKMPSIEAIFLPTLALISDLKGNEKWKAVLKYCNTIQGAWFLKRCVSLPRGATELPLDSNELQILLAVDPVDWVNSQVGSLSDTSRIALAQIESVTYLKNQLLRDSDWASMSHGIELRCPLVDIKLLTALSGHFEEISRSKPKSLLANSLLNKLPASILKKKKTGFCIPIRSWVSSNGNHLRSDTWTEFIEKYYENSIRTTSGRP
jgi:asparagine synthase (glutamine-hydrolysing)